MFIHYDYLFDKAPTRPLLFSVHPTQPYTWHVLVIKPIITLTSDSHVLLLESI